jgi:hypothetical protein
LLCRAIQREGTLTPIQGPPISGKKGTDKAKYKARDFRSEGGDKGFDVDIGSSGKGWYIGRSHLWSNPWNVVEDNWDCPVPN